MLKVILRLKSGLSHLRKNESGVAAIEFAMIFPVLLLLFLSMVDVTAMLSLNRKINYSASTVSDLLAQNRKTVFKAGVEDYYKAVNIITGTSNTVRVELFDLRVVGSNVQTVWKTSNGVGNTCGGDPDLTGLRNLMTAGSDLIISRVCTTFKPAFGAYLGKDGAEFDLSSMSYQRPRNSLELNCFNSASDSTLCN